MTIQRTFASITGLQYIDYCILRSIVLWSQGFREFGEPVYAIAVDVGGGEFEDYAGVAQFIRERITSIPMNEYITIDDDLCEPTEEGRSKLVHIEQALVLVGSETDPTILDTTTMAGVITESLKPYGLISSIGG